MPTEQNVARQFARAFARIASASVILLGGLTLVGWVLHVEALKKIVPGSDIPIKPNIAAGMLFCGVALALLSRKTLTKPIRICAAAMAATVIIVSALTVGEFCFGGDLGFEHWLIGNVPAAEGISHPGRMPPLTALSFILMGVALFMASRLIQKRPRLALAGGLAGALVATGGVSLIGFLLEMLFGPRWNYMGMTAASVAIAVAFFLLGGGLLALLRGHAHLTWSLDRMTTAGFVIGFAVMIVAVALTYNFTAKMRQTAMQVGHAQEILREIEEIEANLSDLEREQRSYIITGNERLLEDWDVKVSEISYHFGKLRKLEADNSRRQPLLRQFAALAWERIDWAKQTVEARREHGFPTAQEMVAAGTGVLLSEKSRGSIQAIENDENTRLRESETQSEIASRTAFLLLPLGVFLCVVIVSVGLFFLNSGMGERKTAGRELRESEERMRAILDSALDCVITMDHQGRVVEFNPAAEKTFGFRRDEAIGELLSDLIIPPALRERHRKGLSHYLATGEAPVMGKRLEISAVRRDSSEFPIELAITRIGSQVPPMFTGFIRDITERKRGEEALRQAEERYRGIFENAVEGIFQTTPDGKFIAANFALARLLGFDSPEDLIAARTDIAHENYVDPRSREEFKRLLDENGSVLDFELEAYRKDRSKIWLSENVRAVRDAKGMIAYYEGTAEDITKRKQAEDALRASEERYRSLFESNPNPMWVYDVETLSFLAVNATAIEHYGYSQDEFLAMTIKDIRPAEDVPALMNDLSERNGGAKDSTEWRHCRKDRAMIYVEIASQDLIWLGRAARLVLINDITERKEAERKLLEQANLLNLAQDAIMVRGMDDRIEFWNRGAEHLYGWSAEEVRGQPSSDFLDYEKPVKILAERTLLETGTWSGECRHLTKQGDAVIVRSRWALVRDEHGQPKAKLIIMTNMTEQKKLETHLLRAQRLESIGTLASGVAHDLNNILTPILMCTEVLRQHPSEKDAASSIALIEESARRGANVVKQVLTFARGIEGERVVIKPVHLIQEMIDIAQKTFPKTIEILSRYPNDLWSIEGDPTQLHQVLLNLSVNARDAMFNGGRLTLAAENFDVDENYATMMPGAKPGPHVMLRVTDTGRGMPRAMIDKIFDPFFTTKEVGKGTGLGLSTTLGIVKSHGGFISVYSEPSKGTTFKVFLPATVIQEDLQQFKTSVVPIQGNGQGQLILVVDDEPNILGVTKMILEKHKYDVVSASDGPEALAIFAQRMQAISLVLTDLSMPYMDGIALVRSLKKMRPDLSIVASTGQGDQASVAELQSLGVKNFLTKPYNTERLLATLDDTLHGRDGGSPGVQTNQGN